MGGGSEQALLNMLIHNANSGHGSRIDILVLFKGGILENRLKEKEFEHYRFYYVTSSRIIFKLLFILCRHRLTASLISGFLIKKRYDTGICYEESRWSSLIAWSNKIERKVCWFHCVVTTHPGFRNINTNPKSLLWYKSKHKMIHRRVFVSEASKQSFEILTGITENNSVIYNVVDYKRILNLAGKHIENPFKQKAGTALRIVMVGNLYDVKNYPFALEVFKSLKDKETPFEVIILGKGDNYHNLKRFIELHELQEYVSLLGYVENPYPYILQSDLYFSSSLSEARPTAIIEAICLKKPYLVPAIPAYLEIHRQYDAGITYNPSSADEAVESIVKVYSNDAFRKELTANIDAIDWDKIGSEYLDVIQPLQTSDAQASGINNIGQLATD